MGVTSPCRDYWRLLQITWYFSARASASPPSTELRQGISSCVISVRSWSYQAAINKGHPLHVDGLEGVLLVPEIFLRSLGYRWKDKKKVVCVVDTPR